MAPVLGGPVCVRVVLNSSSSSRGFFPGRSSRTPAETVSISIGVGAAPDLERSHATILRPLLLGSSLNAA